MIFRFSPSSLALYLSCPRCYYFAERHGLKRPMGGFPSLPGAIDRIVKPAVDACREEGALPAFLEAHLPGRLAPLPKKLRAQSAWGEIAGILDELVVLDDGRYAPVDWKTSGEAPSGAVKPMYRLQLDLYAWLLQENGLPPADTGYLVYLVPAACPDPSLGIPFTLAAVPVPLSVAHAQETVRAAATVLAHEVPPASGRCPYCAWFRRRSALEQW